MFPKCYFAACYFAPCYWPPVVASAGVRMIGEDGPTLGCPDM